jgi:hypothetical protein
MSKSATAIVVLSFCFIMLPPILAPIRPEDLLLLVLIFVCFLKRKTLVISVGFFFLFLAISGAYILSIVSGALITGLPIVVADLFFIGLLLKYAVIFVLVTNLWSSQKLSVYAICVMITWLGAFSAILGIGQYFDILSINDWLTPIYISNDFYLDKLVNNGALKRSVGTSFNANHFAVLLLFPIVSAMLLVLVYGKYRYSILILVLFFSLGCTLSRTGVVAALLILFIIYSLVAFKTKKYLGLWIVVLVVMFIISFILTSDGFSDVDLVSRFSFEELDIGNNNSIGERVMRWFAHIKWLEIHPEGWWFGIGSQKAVASIAIDSQYFGLLKTNGIVGLTLFVFAELYVLLKAFLMFKHSQDQGSLCISLYVIGIMSGFMIFQITIEMFNDVQLYGLLIMLSAILFKKSRENSKLPEKDFILEVVNHGK